MLNDLKNNLALEKQILQKLESALSGSKKDNVLIDSLKNQIKILNKQVPVLLEKESPIKKLSNFNSRLNPSKEKTDSNHPDVLNKKSNLIGPKYGESVMSLEKKDSKQFAKEMKISEDSLEKLRKQPKEEKVIIRKPSQMARLANIFFSNYSEKLTPYLTDLTSDLRKSNMKFMTSTYISIALMTTSLVFIASLLGVLILSTFYLSIISYLWVPFILAIGCIVGFYLYPSTEKSDVDKKISNELPFATIYMAAIAGSNIEPTKVFKIIAMTKDYPQISVEMKKIINQIEIYGYDLVTALKNVSKSTPNKRMGELFNGMATNIISGGSLKNYLDKKAENFLMDYKLERQRYSALAETFMDIYISILITAPMILIMMLVIMNITGLGGGWDLNLILILSIFGVAAINVIFMFVLKVKQPTT